MLTKFTTITIAAAAGLGALAISAPSASAQGISISFQSGHYWGHRRWRYGYRYYTPVVYSAAYLSDCYYVRRRGLLFRVCD